MTLFMLESIVADIVQACFLISQAESFSSNLKCISITLMTEKGTSMY